VRKVRAIKRSRKKTEVTKKSKGIESANKITSGYWGVGSLPTIHFHVDREEVDPGQSLHVLRALGSAPGNLNGEQIADVLAPVVRVARDRVIKMMDTMADFMDGKGIDSDKPTQEIPQMATPSDSSPSEEAGLDELLVHAALKRGELKPRFVAEALGITADQALQYLDWLVEDGRLRVMVEGDDTRYLPAEDQSQTG